MRKRRHIRVNSAASAGGTQPCGALVILADHGADRDIELGQSANRIATSITGGPGD